MLGPDRLSTQTVSIINLGFQSAMTIKKNKWFIFHRNWYKNKQIIEHQNAFMTLLWEVIYINI